MNAPFPTPPMLSPLTTVLQENESLLALAQALKAQAATPSTSEEDSEGVQDG